jgi:hypothetical protein
MHIAYFKFFGVWKSFSVSEGSSVNYKSEVLGIE